MEHKFVNKIVHTESLYREMQFAAKGKLRIILYTAVAVFALLTSLLLFADKVFDTAVILFVLSLLLLALTYVRPMLAAKQQCKRNAVLANGQNALPVTLSFGEDSLEITNPAIDSTVTYDYKKFKKLKKTRHLYLLVLPHSLYLMVNKNGFTTGTPEEFEAFIKEKIKK